MKRAMREENDFWEPRIRRPVRERRRPMSANEFEWNDPQLDAALRRLRLKE